MEVSLITHVYYIILFNVLTVQWGTHMYYHPFCRESKGYREVHASPSDHTVRKTDT